MDTYIVSTSSLHINPYYKWNYANTLDITSYNIKTVDQHETASCCGDI